MRFIMSLAFAALVAAGMLAAPGAAHANPNAIVSTEWLAGKLNDPKVRVVEVSVDPGLYERGHIPGAANVSWHTDLVDTVRRDIATRENFEKLASRLGIGPDTTVVLYGDHNNWFAAWGVWVFNTYGVADVRLLDGGRKKWELEKRELSTQVPQIRATNFKVAKTESALRARLNDVLAIAEGKQDGVLVDIRSPDEFSGKVFAPAGVQELAVRAGHVPGAKNVPWSQAVNQADGTLKSADELRKLYAAAGIDGGKPVIVYCRIGERSSHTWFVLSRVLGYNNVRNYDGSWTEYGNAVGVPVVNLAGTVWGGR
jgi:thiosulfate/3-mercaptopyruvate sulfurtransferase